MEWAQHPVTQFLLSRLKSAKQETMEAWAQEKFVGETIEKTYGENAKALGGLAVLDQVIDLIENGNGA